jgi:hypothetical protein
VVKKIFQNFVRAWDSLSSETCTFTSSNCMHKVETAMKEESLEVFTFRMPTVIHFH